MYQFTYRYMIFRLETDVSVGGWCFDQEMDGQKNRLQRKNSADPNFYNRPTSKKYFFAPMISCLF